MLTKKWIVPLFFVLSALGLILAIASFIGAWWVLFRYKPSK